MADHAEEQYDGFDDCEELVAEKPKRRYSKAIVALCIVTCIVYTVTCFAFLWNGKQLDMTLHLCFFGMFGVELASCAAVTCSKNKHAVKGDAQARQLPRIEIEEEGNE